MIDLLKRGVKRGLAAAGYEIRRRPAKVAQTTPRRRGLRVNMGCGQTRKDGFVGCDIQPWPGVEIVCCAWELSMHCVDIRDIYSRHMLEHLTQLEVTATLADWFQALASGGHVHIIVPDLDFHCKQWLAAKWDHGEWAREMSDANHAFHSIFGWQRGTERRFVHGRWLDEPLYWDVHKSGFGKGLMKCNRSR